MAQAPGYKKLMSWTNVPIMPTPGAVGEIIQRITNKTFNENFNEYVANPLGLESTNFTLEGKKFPKEVYRHESSELKTIPSIFKLLLINKIPMISGTCISSSYDLAKFYNELIKISINND